MHIFIISIFSLLLFQMHQLMAQATIVVRHDYAPEEIEAQARYYADLFGFKDDVHIIIGFSHSVSRDVGGYTRYQNALKYQGGHQIYITINRKAGRSHQMHTLAHEMVHARQFVEGRLIQCDHQHFSWDEGLCVDVGQTAYHDRPWEKEAQTVGAQIYDAYRQQSVAWSGQ
jgi:hypothetical protein